MSTSRSSDLSEALKQIAVRIGVLAGVMVVAIWFATRQVRTSYEIGSRAVVYDARVSPLIGDRRIQIIDYGLEAGRGLAYDSKKDLLYFADAWDAIQVCSLSRLDDGSVRSVSCPVSARLPKTNICPDGQCAPVDLGGLVLDGDGHLLVAIRHQRRLLLRNLNKDGAATNFGSVIRGDVHDAASVDTGVVVVGETVEEVSSDGDRKQVGRLYQVGPGNPVQIKTTVSRPVGVAYSRKSRRLYVADVDGGVERWRYYKQGDDKQWTEAGVVWTEPLPAGSRPPSLQSMVIARRMDKQCEGSEGADCEAIFAAGPQGLYVFDPDGGLLAKYLLGGDVAGLALAKRRPKEKKSDLFMTLGRRLAVLRVPAELADEPIELHTTMEEKSLNPDTR